MVLKSEVVHAQPISPPEIKNETSKLMSASQKSADLELDADIFKPSGSNLALIKSTSFEAKMSKQKQHWEVISHSLDAKTIFFFQFARIAQ